MQENGKRKISAGTVVMLAAAVLILGLTAFVWLRLSSGKTVDLSRLQADTIELQEKASGTEDIPSVPKKETASRPSAQAAPTSEPAGLQHGKSFTLTAGGTVALDGEVRKNSWYSDAKQYDYYDIMMLLKREMQSDLNLVFTENLLSEDGRSSDLTAGNAAAAMLKNAGFNLAACGFSKAFEKGEEGIRPTRKLLAEYGITPVGIYESSDQDPIRILDVNGIRTAFMQYTDTLPAATRKSMAKNGTSGLVPEADAEKIAADIADARARGSEAVIILLNWGKTGKAPDRNMRAMAQKIADAGADLIIGNGSRIVSGAEMLTASGDGRQVLCVWSLGTVLSGDRSRIGRMAGMLLQVTVRTENGRTEIGDLLYIPLYTWKYKQDSRFYYRCLAANGAVPDGMDAEQQKMMKKAADTVRSAMKDSPAEERTDE